MRGRMLYHELMFVLDPQAVPEVGSEDPRGLPAESHDRDWRWWLRPCTNPEVGWVCEKKYDAGMN